MKRFKVKNWCLMMLTVFSICASAAGFSLLPKHAKNSSLYDTGKTAKYGDSLITLSTCAYHVDDGKFVVVARKRAE